MKISQSDVVRVRRTRWRIVDIRAYDQCQVLTLVGVGPTNHGIERRILAPFDVVERIERRTRPTRIPSRVWRRACRALIAAETPPGGLRCARLARIDLLPHQLDPVLALVRGLGSRVLLADDVGLGKTIQAGLIVSELRALGAAERVLIVTPAGLRDQWAQELSARFDIDAVVLDVRGLRRAVGALPLGVNPWQTVPVAITSVDYIKRAEVLAAAGDGRWDVVVVDEAHGVAGDSDRHAAVAALSARVPYVVLLTATPHSGDRRAFASLCGLGATAGDALLVFRRTRQDVRLGTARRVHRLHVRLSADEARMHALLERFSQAVRRERGPGNDDNDDYWLALSVLHKRALSSAQSLQRSIDRRLAMLAGAEGGDASQLRLPLGDLAGELTTADEAPGWSPLLSLRNEAYERQLLRALVSAAATAARHETKIRALGRLLRRVNEPAIVFTEYRDTLLHIRASLGLPSVVLHGGLTRDERLAAIDQFTCGASPLLLATDAAGEGLNLHQTCRIVVNLELPWNPMRLEQRIGRVDRIGQRRTVHVFHLIGVNSGESHILARLHTRVAQARADIGGPDPLGSGGERVITRLIIAGDLPDDTPQAEPADAAQPTQRLWTPSLAREAQAEAGRIARARTFVRVGDEQVLARLEGRGPSVATARRWQTRAWLGSRALMFWQIAAEDGSGRSVGSTVVTVAIDLSDGRDMTRLQIDDVLSQLHEHILKRVELAAETWRGHAASVHHAFISTRLARERTTQARLVILDPPRSQPGLFDRRTEQARSAIVAARHADDRDRADRIAALGRANAVSFPPPRLLLVLTR